MSLLLPFQLLLWCAILWLLQSTEHGTTIGDSLDEDIFHNSFSTPDLLPLRNVELEQRLNDITSSTFQDRLSFPQSMPSSPSMNEPIINVNKNSMSFLTSIQIEFSDGMYSPLDSEESKKSVCRSEIRSLALREGICIYISTSSRYRFLKGARGHQTHSGDRESDHSVSIAQIQHSPSVFYSLTSIIVSLKSYPEYRGNASALFHYLSTKLSSAVSSGNFTSHLRAISSELNSSSTMAATCLSCSTFNFSVETHGNLATSPSTSPSSSGLPTLSPSALPSAVVYQPPKCSPVESAPSGSPQNEGHPTTAPSLVAPPPPPPSSPSSSSRTQPDLLVPITAGAALLCLGVICAIVYSRGMSRCGVCSGKIHSEGCSTDNGKQLPDRSLVFAGRAMSSPLPQLQELHQVNSSRPSSARPDPAATFSTMEESSEEAMREQLQRMLSRMNLLEKENATLRVRVTRLEQNLPGAAAAAYSSPLPPPPNPFRRPGSNDVLNGGGYESHSQSEAEREQREPGDVQPIASTGASIFAPTPGLSQLSPLLPPPNPFRRPDSNDVWNGGDFESRSQSEAEMEQRTTSVTASIFAPGPALSQLGTPPRPLVLTPRERRSPPRPCATPPPTPPLTPPTERSGKQVFGLPGQTRTPGIGIPVSLPTPPPSPRRLALSLFGEDGELNMNYDDLAFGSHFDGKGNSLQKHCEYSWQHSLSMSNSPLASSRETMGDR